MLRSSHFPSFRCGLGLVRVAVVAAVAFAAAPVHANLLIDGSCETPVISAGIYGNDVTGATAITGWTVVGINAAVTSGTFTQRGITFEAQDGVQWLDLAGVTSSKSNGVTQTIATAVGSTYRVSFYVGSVTDNLFFFPTTIDLSINGGARVSYTNPTAPRDSLDWARFTADFVASSTSSTITFLNGNEPSNFYAALDNASVDLVEASPPPTRVPEPEALALCGIGMLALGMRRRRSLRAAA